MDVIVQIVVALGLIVSGWWGRYDYPVIAALVAGPVMLLGTGERFDVGFGAMCFGLIVAYLRRPIVQPDWPSLPR